MANKVQVRPRKVTVHDEMVQIWNLQLCQRNIVPYWKVQCSTCKGIEESDEVLCWYQRAWMDFKSNIRMEQMIPRFEFIVSAMSDSDYAQWPVDVSPGMWSIWKEFNFSEELDADSFCSVFYWSQNNCWCYLCPRNGHGLQNLCFNGAKGKVANALSNWQTTAVLEEGLSICISGTCGWEN